MSTNIELTVDRPANDGAGVARDSDGRTVFCKGALLGERVEVELTQEKKRFARGVVVDVLEPSPERISPACPTHHAGCGGCDLAHGSFEIQREIKAHVVRDALERVGRVPVDTINEAWVGFTEPTVDGWYRTTARLMVARERLGYRRAGSHDAVVADTCGVVHPLIEKVIAEGKFPGTAGPEVVLRASVADDEVFVIVDGDPAGVKLPDQARLIVRSDLEAGQEQAMTEDAAGRSWIVSAGSFFQAGPAIATSLVDAVRAAVGDVSGTTLVDAYCGVGLFAGTIGQHAASVIAIESSASSIADAEQNLSGPEFDDVDVELVHARVQDWEPEPADIVIADPARSGLGLEGVETLAATQAPTFVLVSCDTGSFGRDTALLINAGYNLQSVRLVDAFRDTSHVETIATFTR